MAGLRNGEGLGIFEILDPEEDRLQEGDSVVASIAKHEGEIVVSNTNHVMAKNPMMAGSEYILVEPPSESTSWDEVEKPLSLRIVEDDLDGGLNVAKLSDFDYLEDEQEEEISEGVDEEVEVENPRQVFSSGDIAGSRNDLLGGHQ